LGRDLKIVCVEKANIERRAFARHAGVERRADRSV
jgi:hypothetical protein